MSTVLKATGFAGIMILGIDYQGYPIDGIALMYCGWVAVLCALVVERIK